MHKQQQDDQAFSLNRFFISEQFHSLRTGETVFGITLSQSLLHQRTVSQPIRSADRCSKLNSLNRFFISEANSFTAWGDFDWYIVCRRLNRFFISEQFHRGSDRALEGDAVQSQSLLHQRTVSQDIRHICRRAGCRVSIASSSANSFTGLWVCTEANEYFSSQSLLHQRTVSQMTKVKTAFNVRFAVSIASSSANSFTGSWKHDWVD